MFAIAFTDMATSDHEGNSRSGNQAPETIGPLQKKSRTFDIGTSSASTRKTIWGNVNQAIIPKENTYTYEPMDYHEEIRILKIVHGKKTAPVECMLYRSALQPSTHNPSLSLLETYPYSPTGGGMTSPQIQFVYTKTLVFGQACKNFLPSIFLEFSMSEITCTRR
jgi:hypothetical protein